MNFPLLQLYSMNRSKPIVEVEGIDGTLQWDYAGGDIGNIWVDTKGKKYHHIICIMEIYCTNENRNFIVDYKKGEIFLEDEPWKHRDVRDESNYLGFDDGGEG